MFADRREAAEVLMDQLPLDRMKQEEWVIVAVASGGVVLAGFLHRKLGLRIDWLFNEMIPAPNNPTLELGRISENEEIVIHEELVAAFDVKYDYIYGEARRRHEEKILANIYHFRHGRAFPNLQDQRVMLIDQGSESGLKMACGIKSILTMDPEALYVAAPVMPMEVAEALESYCDALYCPHILTDYIETTCYYTKLEKVSDMDLKQILGE